MAVAAVERIVAERLATTLEKKLVFSTAAEARAAAPSSVLVGTHDGSFHCDEAMACGILHFTQQFAAPAIVRSRVPAELEQCTAVVDVGAKYEPDTLRLDHHQPEFQGTMTTSRKTYKTRLSSAGLVYRHFGKEIIANIAKQLHAAGSISLVPDEAQLDLVHDVVYTNFVEHIDGGDNGVEAFSAAEEGGKLVKNYSVPSTLPGRVGALHPRWNEEQNSDDWHRRFERAMSMCALEFTSAVEYVLASWLPARAVVEQAFDKCTTEHASGSIMVMRDGFAPWKDHVYDLEAERGVEGRTLYVVFGDRSGARVQCVSDKDSTFKNRKSLPWRGLRGDELSKASGIPGGVFVHVSGFIGGNETVDGALAMALKARESDE